MCDCANGQVLRCSRNYLTHLPSQLATCCPRLEQLNADHNRLSGLPHSLGGLVGLIALSVDGNPDLASPPPEINRLPSREKIR